MKLNVLCTKWGNQYTDEYVEKLYRGCKDKLLYDFEFYCLTDNTDPIKGVHLRDPEGIKYWNSSVKMMDPPKRHYFKKDFLSLEGYILALDLDMIILDHFDLNYDKPTTIWKYWRSQTWFDSRQHEERTQTNGSMYFYKQNSMVNYFNDYIQNEDEHVQAYAGSDNYHQYCGKYDWQYFDKLTCYSYSQGAHAHDTERGKYRPAYSTCIFNGDSPMIHACDNWVKDYWS